VGTGFGGPLDGEWIVEACIIRMYLYFYSKLQYEVNTMSIMKPAKRAPYLSLILSVFLTFLMMIISVIYGNKAIKHQRGLFVGKALTVATDTHLFHLRPPGTK